MEKKFRLELEKLAPQPEKMNFLLAVSGGADSSVLAYLFHICKLNFSIAHCNFHLRDKDADLDMALVRQMAVNYKVPYFEKEFDTLALQQNSGISIEMMARDLRYDWFKKLSPSFDYVVTAHHANDNAETLLLNLCRGTGLKGLTAIPPKIDKFIRPLLTFTAEEIRNFAAQNHIVYRDDKTNFEEQYQRNKIRLTVIPKLEEINPNLLKTLTRDVKLLRNQYDFYSRQMKKLISEIVTEDKEHFFIDKDKLVSSSFKELILNEILRNYGFNAAEVNEIISIMDDAVGRRFLSSTHILVVDRKYLHVSRIQHIESEYIIINNIEKLTHLGFKVEHFDSTTMPSYKRDGNCLYADAEKLKFPLCLRQWKEGDSFHPFGMKGSKKISDFFVDQKIDVLQKQKIRLLLSDSKIVWVVGYRSDDRFKIDNNTKSYYKIKYYGSNE